ncbi:MFS transporter [Kitasatospora sp. NPDC088783]|uniref:MFS transporter n=1 Tax=Kitasatospora sp. NPDC088783 TaxID=3364077 RepID=UPI00382FD825
MIGRLVMPSAVNSEGQQDGAAAARRTARQIGLIRTCDSLAGSVAQTAIPVAIFRITGSALWAGSTFALEWTARLVAISCGGALIDRSNPRTLLIASACARVLVAAATITAFMTGAGPLAIVAAGAAVGAINEVSYLTLEKVGAAVAVSARAQAAQTAIDQGTVLLGPLLAGTALLAGPAWAFTMVAVLSTMAAGAAWPLTHRPMHARSTGTPARALRAGVRAVLKQPVLCWMTAALASMNLLAALLQAATPVLVATWTTSPAAVGIAWSAAAAAAIAAAAAAGRILDRVAPRRLIVAVCAGAALATACAAAAPTYALFTAALALLAAAEGVALVVLRTTRVRLLPPSVFGAAVAVMIFALLLPMPLGGLLTAGTDPKHLPYLLVAAAAVHAAVTGAAAIGLGRLQSRPQSPPAPGADRSQR